MPTTGLTPLDTAAAITTGAKSAWVKSISTSGPVASMTGRGNLDQGILLPSITSEVPSGESASGDTRPTTSNPSTLSKP